MKAAVALCAALMVAPVFADELVVRDGDNSVRLAESPCQNQQVLVRVEAGTQAEYKEASAVVEGQAFVACWRAVGSVAHVVYEDGDQGIIPIRDLKRELSA